MAKSNLPPGCRESDIPGNTTRDRKIESIAEEFLETLEEADILLSEDEELLLTRIVVGMVLDAEDKGFQEGQIELRLWNKIIPFTEHD